MPKIAYEIGIEPQQEVTKEWIQDKLNSAKALMQGRIDEENLCVNNTKQLLKTVKDKPTEVVAYDNCMKFFRQLGDSTTFGQRTPYEDLFQELVKLCKASPDIAVVGGILDSDMVVTGTMEESEGETQEVIEKTATKDLEVPPNYVPMTWGELADLMIASGFKMQDIIVDNEVLKLANSNQNISNESKKQKILEMFNAAGDNYVTSYNYSINWSTAKTDVNYYSNTKDISGDTFGADIYGAVAVPEFDIPSVAWDPENSKIKLSQKVNFYRSLAAIEESGDDELEFTKESGATTIRFIPEFLFKVV